MYNSTFQSKVYLFFSRTCLNLIEDVPSSIEEELDLISSVSLLQDFNVNILPLQGKFN